MAAKSIPGWISVMLLIPLAACAVVRSESVTRIALLAPFEGRYREVGYEALYAARLALKETGVELLPIDDGGTPSSAADRASALHHDPQVTAVLVLGNAASDEGVLRVFGDLPAYVVGNWTAPQIDLTEAARLEGAFECNQICTLPSFRRLRASYSLPLEGITILANTALPDDNFRQRYRDSAEFAPEPGLIAVETYAVTRFILGAPDERLPRTFAYSRDGELTEVNRP